MSEYLTPEEKEKIAVLMKAAEERRKKIMEADAEKQFMLLGCQCGCMNQMNEKNKHIISSCGDMKKLLNIICKFCREHGCCVCNKDDDRRGDEELPFG